MQSDGLAGAKGDLESPCAGTVTTETRTLVTKDALNCKVSLRLTPGTA